MRHRTARIASALILAVLSSCACPQTEVRLEGADRTLTVCVDLAVTEDERRRGLMGRAALQPGEGMLFEWPVENEVCFFNAGVSFPIDIVYADGAGRVVAIEREVPANDETVRCHVAMTVLEVAARETAGFDIGAQMVVE